LTILDDNIIVRKLNDLLVAILIGFMVAAIIASNAWADPAPLPLKNRFPLHFMFLTPKPMPPQRNQFEEFRTSVVLDYTSINFDHADDRWAVLMDMELATVEISLSYGVTPRWSIGLDLPLVTMMDGVLDDLLESYHDALNVPNYGREDRPKNSFAYQIEKDGQTWINGRSSGFTLADSTVFVAYALPGTSAKGAFRSSLVGRIKTPVGDKEMGLGSGRWDAGIYLNTGWFFNKWSFFLTPGYAWISDPETKGADVSSRNSISLFAGFAYQYNARWHLLAQLNGYTSPVEETGIGALDDGSLELGLGFQYAINPDLNLTFAFGEDLSMAGPDFTASLGLAWSY
jgi:hypothetical protein